MIKEGQKIRIGISGRTLHHYLDLGYDVKIGDWIEVPPEHLPDQSTQKIDAICDIGGEEVRIEYRAYVKNIKKNNGVFECRDCFRKDKEKQSQIYEKVRKTNIEKYGIEHPAQLEEFKEKGKQTSKERYGVDYPSQSKEIKNKIKGTLKENWGVEVPLQNSTILSKMQQTNLEKYGVDNVAKDKEVIDKIKQTNLEKYGVEWTMQNRTVKEKAEQTNLAKYGGKSPISSPLIKKKMNETLLKNGKGPVSKPQQLIYDILSKEYEECYLNYPLDYFLLDCVLFTEGVKIDIEYDGWYWHHKKKVQSSDNRRNGYMYKNGFKILRIKGIKSIPSLEELKEKINILINSEEKYQEIILEEWKLKEENR